MEVALILLAALVGVGGVLYLLDCAGRRKEQQRDLKGPATVTEADMVLDAASGGAAEGSGGAAEGSGGAASGEVVEEEGCCGMHITCEKDSLLAGVSQEIVYYDDEELDAYKGREQDQYSEAEIEEFRDVLLTLLPSDIAGWGRSLQLRGINLPQAVRDELLLIVTEARG